jgi:hypothetical protein
LGVKVADGLDYQFSRALLLLAFVRVALGLAIGAVAAVRGLDASRVTIAMLVGLFICGLALVASGRLVSRRPVAVVATSVWMLTARLMLPSTVGVAVLAAIALFDQPVLSALLGGILAALALPATFAAMAIRRQRGMPRVRSTPNRSQ